MVANRACAPSAKLYCYEQWRREDVRIEGAETLALHHLYRAMDGLEAHKEAIEKAIYFRLADLLHWDVELIFYDTTSLHFEIDEIDRGQGESDEVEGSAAAGAKTYQAPRKRGLWKDLGSAQMMAKSPHTGGFFRHPVLRCRHNSLGTRNGCPNTASVSNDETC